MVRRGGGRGGRRTCLALALVVASTAAAAAAQDPSGGATPSPAMAAVAALRRQDFAGALRIAEEARPPLAAARGEDDPAVLTLRILAAQASYGLGRPEDAVALLDPFRRTLDSPTPLVSAASDWNALNVLADSSMALDRWPEALSFLNRALELVDGGEGVRANAVDRATTLGKIGTAKARLGDWEGAERSFEAQREALESEPDGGGAYLAAAHSGLGLVADNRGDRAAAVGHYAEAARIYERALGPDHPATKRARETLDRRRSPADAAPAPVPVPAPVPRWPVVAAIAAALILSWLLRSGFLSRRAGAAGSEAGDE